MSSRRVRAPTAGKAKPLGGAKTEGMGVERQTKVGTRDPPLDGKPLQVNGYSGDRPPSPWRASRERQHDREVKREAVIRAAAHAFNHKGYHNTSLDDIAAALEVTKPTVYYYVSNKEQLLFECFVAGIEPVRAAFREARSLEMPARERLNAVFRNY